MDYYYFSAGQRIGPINFEQVKNLIANGTIFPETIIEINGSRGQASVMLSLKPSDISNESVPNIAPNQSAPLSQSAPSTQGVQSVQDAQPVQNTRPSSSNPPKPQISPIPPQVTPIPCYKNGEINYNNNYQQPQRINENSFLFLRIFLYIIGSFFSILGVIFLVIVILHLSGIFKDDVYYSVLHFNVGLNLLIYSIFFIAFGWILGLLQSVFKVYITELGRITNILTTLRENTQKKD